MVSVRVDFGGVGDCEDRLESDALLTDVSGLLRLRTLAYIAQSSDVLLCKSQLVI
ncbi:hypothetical protein D3C84_1090560 [compost metagenome]